MSKKGNDELRAAVRDARKSRDWTQEQVAQKAGVVLRTYQAFENGESWPQRANLEAILTALDMDGEGSSEDRGDWSPDVGVFLDVLGTYLEGLDDKERLRFIRSETRRLFAQMSTRDVDPNVYRTLREGLADRAARQSSPPTEKVKRPRREA